MQDRIGTLRPRVVWGTSVLQRRSCPSELCRAGQSPLLSVCLPSCTLGSEMLPAEPGFLQGVGLFHVFIKWVTATPGRQPDAHREAAENRCRG